jgi:hypothetical protein
MGANIADMRFVEELRLLDHNRIALIGSVNPVNCEYVAADINAGKETIWSAGLCGSFVDSPDRKHVVYCGAPGVFTPEEDWRVVVQFDNDIRAYNPPEPGGRLTADPIWSADSSRVAVLEHNLITKAKGVVAVPLKGEVTRIPLPVSFEEPIALEWAENTLTLRTGGGRYTVDNAAKSFRLALVEVEEQIAKQTEKRRAIEAARIRVIEAATKLGGDEYKTTAFVPAETQPQALVEEDSLRMSDAGGGVRATNAYQRSVRQGGASIRAVRGLLFMLLKLLSRRGGRTCLPSLMFSVATDEQPPRPGLP